MDKKDKRFFEFVEKNRNKECAVCGIGTETALFEIHQISDGKYVSDGNTLIMCHYDIEQMIRCNPERSFIDLFNFWLGNYDLPEVKN